MQKIERKIGSATYSFGLSEFKGKTFYSMTKSTPEFKKDGRVIAKAKFQNLTCSVPLLSEFKEFLRQIITEE